MRKVCALSQEPTNELYHKAVEMAIKAFAHSGSTLALWKLEEWFFPLGKNCGFTSI